MSSKAIKFSGLITLFVFFLSTCLSAENSSIKEKILAATPAVVSIKSKLGQENSIPADCSQEDMMWNVYQSGTPFQNTIRSGYGFFVSSDGYIVTSYLTVKDAEKITVTISEHQQTDNVTLVGYDAKSNLALLKIGGENYAYLTLDACEGKAGDWVIGLGKTDTGQSAPRFGVISYYPHSNAKTISFDTVIQSGLPKSEMTGDPLLNMEGKVMGVNVISDAIQITIPTATVQEVINRLMASSR